MVDPSDNENAALDYAGANAGEYLDSLGVTDVAKLNPAQWHALMGVIVGNYINKIVELDNK